MAEKTTLLSSTESQSSPFLRPFCFRHRTRRKRAVGMSPVPETWSHNSEPPLFMQWLTPGIRPFPCSGNLSQRLLAIPTDTVSGTERLNPQKLWRFGTQKKFRSIRLSCRLDDELYQFLQLLSESIYWYSLFQFPAASSAARGCFSGRNNDLALPCTPGNPFSR